MIKLRETFESGDGGFAANPLTYTQIKRNDIAAVYMRSRDGKPYDYETFLIKFDKKGKVTTFPNGTVKVTDDDTEKYPSSSQFGRIAWSYTTLGLAMHKFHELTHGQSVEVEISGNEPEEIAQPIQPADPRPVQTDDAKPYKGPSLLIPVGEFSTKELAAHNNVQYPIAFLFRKEMERTGKIKFARQRKADGRGKPTDIFVSI